jgi:hypothetical protein
MRPRYGLSELTSFLCVITVVSHSFRHLLNPPSSALSFRTPFSLVCVCVCVCAETQLENLARDCFGGAHMENYRNLKTDVERQVLTPRRKQAFMVFYEAVPPSSSLLFGPPPEIPSPIVRRTRPGAHPQPSSMLSPRRPVTGIPSSSPSSSSSSSSSSISSSPASAPAPPSPVIPASVHSRLYHHRGASNSGHSLATARFSTSVRHHPTFPPCACRPSFLSEFPLFDNPTPAGGRLDGTSPPPLAELVVDEEPPQSSATPPRTTNSLPDVSPATGARMHQFARTGTERSSGHRARTASSSHMQRSALCQPPCVADIQLSSVPSTTRRRRSHSNPVQGTAHHQRRNWVGQLLSLCPDMHAYACALSE